MPLSWFYFSFQKYVVKSYIGMIFYRKPLYVMAKAPSPISTPGMYIFLLVQSCLGNSWAFIAL